MNNEIKVNITFSEATSVQQKFDVKISGNELNVVAYTGTESSILEAVMTWAIRKWDYIDELLEAGVFTAVVNGKEYDLEECAFIN